MVAQEVAIQGIPLQRAVILLKKHWCLTMGCVQTYGAAVWSTLALMGVSAVCASATDLAFDLNGYLWQLVNCLFTAGYSLYLRGVMDKVRLAFNKSFLHLCLSPEDKNVETSKDLFDLDDCSVS